MKAIHNFQKFPLSFRFEEDNLSNRGINNWEHLEALTEEDILLLCKKGCGTLRNLKHLRCMASLICKLNIKQEEAALLIHSGISSIEALARLNTQELLNRTSRLHRNLGTDISQPLSTKNAQRLINSAKQITKITF